MIQMLASVTNLQEAQMVLEADVDIIDLKNPKLGALGAIGIPDVCDIVRHINGKKMVSATIGDLPMEAEIIAAAVESMVKTGVDIVKIGFFGQELHHACVNALKPLSQHKLVAVLMADQNPNIEILSLLKEAGFYGAMLDTASKNGQTLLDCMLHNDLQRFVSQAHTIGLKFGLAGSLSAQQVEILSSLKPDYLGFRGALCEQYKRVNGIELQRVLKVKNLLYKCNTQAPEACIY